VTREKGEGREKGPTDATGRPGDHRVRVAPRPQRHPRGPGSACVIQHAGPAHGEGRPEGGLHGHGPPGAREHEGQAEVERGEVLVEAVEGEGHGGLRRAR